MCRSGAPWPPDLGCAPPRGCGAGAVNLLLAWGWPGSSSWCCVGQGSCVGHGLTGSYVGSGEIRDGCPPPSLPRDQPWAAGSWQQAAAVGAEAGLFRGVWRGGCGLALSLLGDPTGTSTALLPGWSILALPVPAEVLSLRGAVRTRDPTSGKRCQQPGGPPGTVWHDGTQGVWLPSKGLP